MFVVFLCLWKIILTLLWMYLINSATVCTHLDPEHIPIHMLFVCKCVCAKNHASLLYIELQVQEKAPIGSFPLIHIFLFHFPWIYLAPLFHPARLELFLLLIDFLLSLIPRINANTQPQDICRMLLSCNCVCVLEIARSLRAGHN